MDLYALLGVARTSSLDEIRSAYRKLALGLHPDRNPGDKEKERRFKEISQAYDVLSDEGRRARYDLERGQPTRVPVQPGPFFRGGRSGFTFTPAGMWGTSAGVNVGASVQIRVTPQMAGQTVQVQIGGVPMPGVYVFVRRG